LHIGIQDFSNDLANRANTMIESVKLGITTSMFTRALGFRTNPISNAAVIHNGKLQETGGGGGTGSGSTSDTEMSTIGDGTEHSVDGTLTPTTVGASVAKDSPRLNAEMNHIISKAKVRALNKTGRVDYCLQEGVFENAYLSALSGNVDLDNPVLVKVFRKTSYLLLTATRFPPTLFIICKISSYAILVR